MEEAQEEPGRGLLVDNAVLMGSSLEAACRVACRLGAALEGEVVLNWCQGAQPLGKGPGPLTPIHSPPVSSQPSSRVSPCAVDTSPSGSGSCP